MCGIIHERGGHAIPSLVRHLVPGEDVETQHTFFVGHCRRQVKRLQICGGAINKAVRIDAGNTSVYREFVIKQARSKKDVAFQRVERADRAVDFSVSLGA